jgi:hypothetical protein
MQTASSFYSKYIKPPGDKSDLNITYRKKGSPKFPIYSRQWSNNNNITVSKTYDDLKLQVNSLPEKMLKTKDLFIETCTSSHNVFPKIAINNPNRTMSNFKPRSFTKLHEKYMELDYNNGSGKVVDFRKQRIDGLDLNQLGTKKRDVVSPRVRVRDDLDEFIEFIKSPANRLTETATFIYKNIDVIKKGSGLKITQNKFITKIINNVIRKVVYMSHRNVKLSEELAINLINDEIEELTVNIDKDIEKHFKIKNFSSVVRDGESVTIIPLLNSFRGEGLSKSRATGSPGSIIRPKILLEYESMNKRFSGDTDLSLIDENEGESVPVSSEKMGRNKSTRIGLGITDDPTKIESEFRLHHYDTDTYIKTPSSANYTDENFRISHKRKRQHRKEENIKGSSIMRKLKQDARSKQPSESKKGRNHDMVLFVRGTSVEDYAPQFNTEGSPRVKTYSMHWDSKVAPFEVNKETVSGRMTVLKRSNTVKKQQNKLSKNVRDIVLQLEEEKVVNVEKLDISKDIINSEKSSSSSDSFERAGSPSKFLKLENSVLPDKTPTKTPGSNPSNSPGKILKSFGKQDTLHRIVNFHVIGKKVKRVGGFKIGDDGEVNNTLGDDLSSSLQVIQTNNRYGDIDATPKQSSNNVTVQQIEPAMKVSKTTSFGARNSGLKSILNKRGSFFSNSSQKESITPSAKESTFSKPDSLASHNFSKRNSIETPASRRQSNGPIPFSSGPGKQKKRKSKRKKSLEKINIDIIDKKITLDQPSERIPMIDGEGHSIIYEDAEINDGNKTKLNTNKTIFELHKNMTHKSNSSQSIYDLESSKSSAKKQKVLFKSDKDQTKIIEGTVNNTINNTVNNGTRGNITNKSSLRMLSKESYYDSSYDDGNYVHDGEILEDNNEEEDIKDSPKDEFTINDSSVSQERRALFLLKKRQSIVELREALEVFRLKDPTQVTEKTIEEFISLTRQPSNNMLNDLNHQQLMKLFEKFKQQEPEVKKVDHK